MIKSVQVNTEAVRNIISGRKTVMSKVIRLPRCDFGENDPPLGVVPLCRKGDILYVREAWDNLPVLPDGTICGYDHYYYKADGDLRSDDWKGKWKPSGHMGEYGRLVSGFG